MTAIIYQWATSPDFLLQRLFPKASVINAKPFVDGSMISQQALAQMPDRNLWFFHLNISLSKSWLPNREDMIASLRKSGYRVINDNIVDIRKSILQKINRQIGLSDVIATVDDEPDMAVMVKTDYNYGGLGELLLSPEEIHCLGLQDLGGCLISSYDQYYRCLLSEVTDEVWQDPRLVVEKYINNKRSLFYRFYRCGSRSVLSEVINGSIIKKMLPGLPRRNWYFEFGEECSGANKEITRNATKLCEFLNLEFGAIDIVVDDDNCPYIIDINPTPAWGVEKQAKILDYLREGF